MGAAVEQREHRRHEEQRRDRREREAADDRAAERRVLLAAFAEPERHRHHADDHRQRGHQHRAEPREPGVERRLAAPSGRAASSSFAKLTTRMLFAVATPMHMIAPVSAGTLIVVCVTNSIQTMPGQRRRQRRDDDERIEPRLEVHDDQQVDEHDGQQRGRPAGPLNDVRIVSIWPRTTSCEPRGRSLLRRLDDRADVAAPRRRDRVPAPSRRCRSPAARCSATRPPCRRRA